MPAPETLDLSPQDAATAHTALSKVSCRLIPLIALGYGTAYIDRVNISFAALQMNQDLHFSATVYGFGAGLFFLSYAACEIPSNLMLYRIGARRWLARIMVTWGIIAAAMLFVRTPMQFYGARFLLGMAEAGFFPGVIFYLGLWYPPRMRARAISGFYIALPLSSVVMGGLAGALMSLQGRLGLTGWQWLFLVEAIPAILLGVVFFFLLPDGPADASWLNDRERTAILAAIPGDAVTSHRGSIAPALRDSRTWLIGIFYLCVQAANYAYTFSGPAIVQKLTNWSIANTGYYFVALGLAAAAAMLIVGYFSDRSGARHKYVTPLSLLMVVGFLGCGLSGSPIIALPALVMVAVGVSAMAGPLWAIPGEFLTGRSAAAGIAAINMIGILGGFIGPYWMGFARDLTGDYQRGLLTMALPMLLATCIMIYLGRHVRRNAGWTLVATSTEVASAIDSPTL